MANWAAYIRVSTHGQNEASQKRELRRWFKGNGIDTADIAWFIDKGFSRDNLDRPAFSEMQSAVFNGEVQNIAVYKLDRVSGRMAEGLTVLTDWLEKDIRFVSTSQQFDFSGTVGKLIAGVLFGVSEMEQETRRERQAAGIAAARERGVYFGRKPGATKAEPARAQALRGKGLTQAEIAQAMGVNVRTVRRYLTPAT